MVETKTFGGSVKLTNNEVDEIFEHLMQLRRRRDSGGGFSLDDVSASEWAAIQLIDDVVEAEERHLRIYAKALFEALARR